MKKRDGKSIPWQDVKIFLAVAQLGSFLAASKQSGVAQTTIGRRIAALENRLGFALFERFAGGAELTELGRQLVPAARGMEAGFDAFMLEASALSSRLTTVRISCDEIIGAFLTENWELLRRNDNTCFGIELSIRHSIPNLAQREADILVRSRPPETNSIHSVPLGEMAFAAYLHQDYVNWRGEPFDSRDPAHWVAFDAEHARFPGYSWLARHLEGNSPSVRTNNRIHHFNLVCAGVGAGIIPCFMGNRVQTLKRLDIDLSELDTAYHLYFHPRMRNDQQILHLVDELKYLFKKNVDLLSGKSS